MLSLAKYVFFWQLYFFYKKKKASKLGFEARGLFPLFRILFEGGGIARSLPLAFSRVPTDSGSPCEGRSISAATRPIFPIRLRRTIAWEG